MSDLIDRQALFKQIEIDSEGIEGSYGDTWKFIDTIKHLPSAEPQIVHCRDCKNLEIDSIFHDCWCNGHKVWLDHYCGYAERRTDGQATE